MSKIRTAEVPFSPKMAAAGLLLKFWGLVVRYKRGHNIAKRCIRQIATKCNITSPLSVTLQEAKQKRSDA